MKNDDSFLPESDSIPPASRAVIVKKLEVSCTGPPNMWGGIDLMPQLSRVMEMKDPEFHLRMQAFYSALNVDGALRGRCSSHLLLDLFFGTEFLGLNPFAVVEEIRSIERQGTSRTKPATPFRGPHLRGLWHKHYMDGGVASLAQNLKSELNRKGNKLSPFFEKRIEEARAAGEARSITKEDLPKIVNDVIWSNLARRMREGRMTGEWIIYVEHESQKFYLCLAKHNDSDEKLREKIAGVCVLEFPFLKGALQGPSPEGNCPVGV